MGACLYDFIGQIRDLLNENLLSSMGLSNGVDILLVSHEHVMSCRKIILYINMGLLFGLIIGRPPVKKDGRH